jgi:hypothetical protein
MLTHQHGGRTWTEQGRKPHVRRDGSGTELIMWATPCAHPGCQGHATCTTPSINFESSKAFGTRHCESHKLPDSVAAGKRAAAIFQEGSQRA